MGQSISCYDGVLLVRIDGRANAQELYQGMRANLDAQTQPITVVIDLTLTTTFDQQVKSFVYRVLQNHHVGAIGFCGANGGILGDINDLAAILRRNRKVTISETESDLRAALGLGVSTVSQTKLAGMLTYLKSAPRQAPRLPNEKV